MDRDAQIVHRKGQSYLTFNSDNFKNIKYNEFDLVRIIKLSTDIYHLEIISRDLEEYKLWHKLCNQTIRSSERKYGLM
ncbi:hypothetical protein D3C73_1162190 [compost metagenome]